MAKEYRFSKWTDTIRIDHFPPVKEGDVTDFKIQDGCGHYSAKNFTEILYAVMRFCIRPTNDAYYRLEFGDEIDLNDIQKNMLEKIVDLYNRVHIIDNIIHRQIVDS